MEQKGPMFGPCLEKKLPPTSDVGGLNPRSYVGKMVVSY